MTAHQTTRRHGKMAGSASWLALVAATSLAGVQAETLRAQIKVPPQAVSSGRRYRLVVQSYDENVRASLIPGSIRPRASTQRGVSADDLVHGIRIDLVELSEASEMANGDASAESGTVVAWVEPGEPDLEFDGRRARPGPGSFYGAVASDEGGQDGVELYLHRQLGGAEAPI